MSTLSPWIACNITHSEALVEMARILFGDLRILYAIDTTGNPQRCSKITRTCSPILANVL